MRITKQINNNFCLCKTDYVLTASMEALTNLLGEPSYTSNDYEDKIHYEWVININGKIISIYDYSTNFTLTNIQMIWFVGSNCTDINKEIKYLTKKLRIHRKSTEDI